MSNKQPIILNPIPTSKGKISLEVTPEEFVEIKKGLERLNKQRGYSNNYYHKTKQQELNSKEPVPQIPVSTPTLVVNKTTPPTPKFPVILPTIDIKEPSLPKIVQKIPELDLNSQDNKVELNSKAIQKLNNNKRRLNTHYEPFLNPMTQQPIPDGNGGYIYNYYENDIYKGTVDSRGQSVLIKA